MAGSVELEGLCEGVRWVGRTGAGSSEGIESCWGRKRLSDERVSSPSPRKLGATEGLRGEFAWQRCLGLGRGSVRLLCWRMFLELSGPRHQGFGSADEALADDVDLAFALRSPSSPLSLFRSHLAEHHRQTVLGTTVL